MKYVSKIISLESGKTVYLTEKIDDIAYHYTVDDFDELLDGDLNLFPIDGDIKDVKGIILNKIYLIAFDEDIDFWQEIEKKAEEIEELIKKIGYMPPIVIEYEEKDGSVTWEDEIDTELYFLKNYYNAVLRHDYIEYEYDSENGDTEEIEKGEKVNNEIDELPEQGKINLQFILNIEPDISKNETIEYYLNEWRWQNGK